MSQPDHAYRAVQLAHNFGVPYAVIEYDHGEGRTIGVVPETYLDEPEYEAFAGRLLTVIDQHGVTTFCDE